MMTSFVKKQNSHLEEKVELRRRFLRKFHAHETPISVMDCCAGNGVIWSRMAREFDVDVFSIDKVPKPGRLCIDSVKVLAAGGWNHTVVDIDTYGSPWRHWQALLATCRHPVTVFLTWGGIHTSMKLDGVTGTSLDLPRAAWTKLPAMRLSELDLSVQANMSMPSAFGLEPIICTEVKPPKAQYNRARYFAVRLEKTNQNKP